MQSRQVLITILSLFSLVSVVACQREEEGTVLEMATEFSGQDASGSETPRGEPASVPIPEASPLSSPAALPLPSPSPASSPVQNPPPASPPLISNVGDRGLSIRVGEVTGPEYLSLTALNPSTPGLREFDETLPLDKVFNVTPLETRFAGHDVTLDPLALIQPLAEMATARFLRASPLQGGENSLEVSFRVRYPSRIRYNPHTHYYETFFPTTWLEFELYACQANGPCRRVEPNIPSQLAGAQPCYVGASHCEKDFSIKIMAAALPAGGVQHSDYYKVVVKGSAAADYQDENGYARLCSNGEIDCTLSHPYCVAGLCSAVTRATDYYRVETPEALRSTR